MKELKKDQRFPRQFAHEWREELGIQTGMTKEEAFEAFLIWQERQKTCQRCECEKLTNFCPLKNICKEANEYGRNVTRDDNRGRIIETAQSQTDRARLSQERKRATIRETFDSEESLS